MNWCNGSRRTPLCTSSTKSVCVPVPGRLPLPVVPPQAATAMSVSHVQVRMNSPFAVGAASGLAAGLWLGGIQWWQQLSQAVAEEEERRRAVAEAPLDPIPGRGAAGRV